MQEAELTFSRGNILKATMKVLCAMQDRGLGLGLGLGIIDVTDIDVSVVVITVVMTEVMTVVVTVVVMTIMVLTITSMSNVAVVVIMTMLVTREADTVDIGTIATVIIVDATTPTIDTKVETVEVERTSIPLSDLMQKIKKALKANTSIAIFLIHRWKLTQLTEDLDRNNDRYQEMTKVKVEVDIEAAALFVKTTKETLIDSLTISLC
jgi:hypothetical protein